MLTMLMSILKTAKNEEENSIIFRIHKLIQKVNIILSQRTYYIKVITYQNKVN